MKYDFDVSTEFVTRCNEIEMEFAYSISDSLYSDGIHHDSNYREAHHRAFGDSLDVFVWFKGKVPEPLFTDVFDKLQETIATDCGW